jgi:hypothetical protein
MRPDLRLILRTFGIAALAVNSLGAPSAQAHKLALAGGAYMLSTSDTTTNEALSTLGAGAYQLQYSIRALPRLAAEIGYFIIIGSGFSGLDSNGLEAGVSYYPFSDAESHVYRADYAVLKTTELFRPYIGGFFAQRQVKSASFAGFGAKAGAEWVVKFPWLIKAEARFVTYSNSLSNPVGELTGNIGIGLEF